MFIVQLINWKYSIIVLQKFIFFFLSVLSLPFTLLLAYATVKQHKFLYFFRAKWFMIFYLEFWDCGIILKNTTFLYYLFSLLSCVYRVCLMLRISAFQGENFCSIFNKFSNQNRWLNKPHTNRLTCNFEKNHQLERKIKCKKFKVF